MTHLQLPIPIALVLLLLHLTVPAAATEQTAVGPSVERASKTQKISASEAFARGDEAFDVQNYQAALEAYRESVAQVNSPNTRLMAARCLLELGRLDEAYAEYAKVIGDAKDDERYAQARTTAEDERKALKSRLAWVALEMGDMPSDVILLLDDRRIGEGKPTAPIAVNPGGAVLVARAKDGSEATARVHLAAGRTVTVTLARNETKLVGTPTSNAEADGEPAASSLADQGGAQTTNAHPFRPWIYVAGGVAVLGATGVTAFGLLAQNRYDSLTEDCPAGQCPASSQRDIDKGKTYQTLANVSLGVGVAGVAAAALLIILDRKPQAAAAKLSLDVGWQSVGVRGRF